MTTTAPEPAKKQPKKRTPKDWYVLTRQQNHSPDAWYLTGPIKALTRKAAISDVIKNAKTSDTGNAVAYVAVPADEWQPLKARVEQPPPVVTLEAAK